MLFWYSGIDCISIRLLFSRSFFPLGVSKLESVLVKEECNLSFPFYFLNGKIRAKEASA